MASSDLKQLITTAFFDATAQDAKRAQAMQTIAENLKSTQIDDIDIQPLLATMGNLFFPHSSPPLPILQLNDSSSRKNFRLGLLDAIATLTQKYYLNDEIYASCGLEFMHPRYLIEPNTICDVDTMLSVTELLNRYAVGHRDKIADITSRDNAGSNVFLVGLMYVSKEFACYQEPDSPFKFIPTQQQWDRLADAFVKACAAYTPQLDAEQLKQLLESMEDDSIHYQGYLKKVFSGLTALAKKSKEFCLIAYETRDKFPTEERVIIEQANRTWGLVNQPVPGAVTLPPLA